MKISIKRAYDRAEAGDGFRVLIDRLWPRGVSKASARIDYWSKAAAPSAELRSWFHVDPEGRFAEFEKRYAAELEQGTGIAELRAAIRGKKAVTFVTAVKDVEHSHVPTLRRRV